MTQEASRRNFLRSVGVAGGAGMLYSAMGALGLAPVPEARAEAYRPPRKSDFTLAGQSGKNGKKVLILGGGIAGLATAYELGKAGYDCRILEAKNRPGGRNWTVRGGTTLTDLDGRTQTASFSKGQYMNAGPARLPQSHVTLEYCRELGVPLEVFTNQNANAYIYHENSAALAGKPIRWRTAKADAYGYVSELLAKATDQGSLDTELTADDKERLIAFLQNFGAIKGKADGFAYTGSDRRGYSVEPGAAFEEGTVLGPVPSLSDVIGSGVGQRFSFEFGYDQAMLMFQPVGGMDAIPYALAKAVGEDRIIYGAKATEVKDLPDGAEVVYKDAQGRTRSRRADFVVAAVPPMVMARVKHNLDADITAALKYPVATPVGKVGLEYRSRWWETDEHIYGGITPTDTDLATIWYPSYGYQGRRGTLIGYYNFGANAVAYSDLPHAERVQRAVSRGVKIHGEKYRTELDRSFSVAWHRTPHIEAGWVGWPSQTGPEYKLLNKPAGHVYFAGDWLSHVIAWQHGAFTSARKVVTDIHERVMAA
ncbi:flavin monoamine oxidase family protein [Streptomyces phaeochromogenes]|uniref:flavin monoamine oxidase family protein n=1 Tax=Streptomyces phaeochromogenes TaxID=1923 RepID=UPI00225616E8|nr:flavin monoamine oxidase family protein [Streptomyces phaeochromogenes]MCX5604040.1 flavin monoamine oxidase family protein [Streptomyces phaeochromogenes]